MVRGLGDKGADIAGCVDLGDAGLRDKTVVGCAGVRGLYLVGDGGLDAHDGTDGAAGVVKVRTPEDAVCVRTGDGERTATGDETAKTCCPGSFFVTLR